MVEFFKLENLVEKEIPIKDGKMIVTAYKVGEEDRYWFDIKNTVDTNRSFGMGISKEHIGKFLEFLSPETTPTDILNWLSEQNPNFL